MASSNAVVFYIAPESVEGQPATTGYIKIPISSENIAPDATTSESTIIRDDRQPQGVIRTGFEVGGQVQTEFMFGAYDELLRAALFSPAFGGGASIVVSDCNLTWSSVVLATVVDAGAANSFSTVVVGDYLQLTSPEVTTPTFVRVESKTDANNITIRAFKITSQPDDETGVSANFARGDRISAGNTRQSYTVVKEFTDVAAAHRYQVITGVLWDQIEWNVAPNQIVTVSFTALGRQMDPSFNGTVDIAGTPTDITGALAAATDAPANQVFDAISNVTAILGGVESTIVTSYQLTMANNVFGTQVVGVLGNRNVDPGAIQITGQIEAIYEDSTLITAFLNQSGAAFGLIFEDADANAYVMSVPLVTLSSAGTSTPGQNQNVPLSLEFSARLDDVTEESFSIQRF